MVAVAVVVVGIVVAVVVGVVVVLVLLCSFYSTHQCSEFRSVAQPVTFPLQRCQMWLYQT